MSEISEIFLDFTVNKLRQVPTLDSMNDMNHTDKDIWLDEFDQAPVYIERNGSTYQVTKVESIDNGEEVCFFGRRLNKDGMTKQVYTITSVWGGDVQAKLNSLNIPSWLMDEIK